MAVRHVHIVDDDGAFLHATALLLRANGFTVDQWASGEAFLSRTGNAEPGCVLLDLILPDIDGLSVMQELVRGSVRLPVVMVSGYGDIDSAIAAMKGGAVDFLEKPMEKAVLLAAIEDALGRLDGLRQQAVLVERARAALALLTPREYEILVRLTRGLSNKGIAQQLLISPRTVEIHRANMMAKLGVPSLAQALRIAFTAAIEDDPD